ncbi:hypothetical protein NVP1121O_124 [Vibrio phage 1.121.O._10N.286.46.C4]|nr:hypothetical protein NVP1121O_124 [Vibrio phage 1.121.O._10N.286.46.C4]
MDLFRHNPTLLGDLMKQTFSTNIQHKNIQINVYTDNSNKVSGYYYNLKGKDVAPLELKLSHKNLTKLYLETYEKVNCSYLDVLLSQLRLACSYKEVYKHVNSREIKTLKARLGHCKNLIDVKCTYKGSTLYKDTNSELFTITCDYKKLIFKSVRAFKQHTTKNS